MPSALITAALSYWCGVCICVIYEVAPESALDPVRFLAARSSASQSSIGRRMPSRRVLIEASLDVTVFRAAGGSDFFDE